MRGKFKFLYVDIWFDVTECKFITKNRSFKMLVVFSPIFVADTKITFVYNFVAPLMCLLETKFLKREYTRVLYAISPLNLNKDCLRMFTGLILILSVLINWTLL